MGEPTGPGNDATGGEAGGPPRWTPRAVAAAPSRRRRWPLMLAAIAALLLLGCALLIVVGSVPNANALALATVAAIVPAAIYGTIVIRLDRYEAEPPRALAAAFAWGAVGAVVLSVAGGLAFQYALQETVSPEETAILSAVVGAPLIEETFKGLALLALVAFFRHELNNTLDGLIYGALIGLGFAMTENILYFGATYLEGGLGDLGQLFLARAVVGGWGHAVYTGTTGAAVGWARGRHRRGVLRFIVPVLGWALAVVLHALWNAGAVWLSATADADATLWTTVVPLAAVVILPSVLLLYVVARISRGRQLIVLREQLEPEVANGTLTPAEFATLTDDARRRQALAAADRDGGRTLRRRQQHFFDVAADLAYRKHHLEQGEPLTASQRIPDDALRFELAGLRVGLPTASVAASV